ncbi:MAG: hypothetical protein OEZ19_11005 [Paracoccaceae bacterium]|nr:hypothetical protein [Paracoccaceae bacterium]
MNRLNVSLQIIFALVTSLQLTGCSKTLQWKEEVQLNTGATIWVKRTVVYTKRGGAGNPLDMAYRRETDQAIEFTWNGRPYYYKGEANIMVLAISPENTPVLVAPADGNAWDSRYHYACTLPYYVQLVPDATGRAWTWPPHIEPWLYNLPTNLFGDFGQPEGMLLRYTVQQKRLQPYLSDPRLVSSHKINPEYSDRSCKQKKK